MKALKSSLRKSIKLAIDSIPHDQKSKQSTLVSSKLFHLEEYNEAQRISIFLSMKDEIDTTEILKHSLEANKQCFIPRYDSKSNFMDMVLLNSWEEYECLPVTKWNIKQPHLKQQCTTALETGGLDLILMPGLAFTSTGHRLGRGRGYYDSFLDKCNKLQKKPITVALAFKEQIVDEVPMETTDQPVDIVLTAE